MPPCTADYLVGYLMEIGPGVSTGMGLAPIDHRDIAAWQSNLGIELQAWEVRALRRISLEYVKQHNQAMDRNCPCPYITGDAEIDNRQAVANQIKNFMRNARTVRG